jgi:hypothetical protein
MMIINYWIYVKSGIKANHKYTYTKYMKHCNSAITNVATKLNFKFISDRFKHNMM